MRDLSIIIRSGYATFGSGCLQGLNNAPFLKMSVGEDTIAFTPDENGNIKFFREMPEKKQLVLRAGREVVKAFEKLSGQSYDKKTGTKYIGEMQDGSLVFTISK